MSTYSNLYTSGGVKSAFMQHRNTATTAAACIKPADLIMYNAEIKKWFMKQGTMNADPQNIPISAGVNFNNWPINKPKKCIWLLIVFKPSQTYTGSREAVHRLTVL